MQPHDTRLIGRKATALVCFTVITLAVFVLVGIKSIPWEPAAAFVFALSIVFQKYIDGVAREDAAEKGKPAQTAGGNIVNLQPAQPTPATPSSPATEPNEHERITPQERITVENVNQ